MNSSKVTTVKMRVGFWRNSTMKIRTLGPHITRGAGEGQLCPEEDVGQLWVSGIDDMPWRQTNMWPQFGLYTQCHQYIMGKSSHIYNAIHTLLENPVLYTMICPKTPSICPKSPDISWFWIKKCSNLAQNTIYFMISWFWGQKCSFGTNLVMFIL